MTKHAQFLFVVQTAILANAVNISTMEPGKIQRHKPSLGASGVLGIAAEAIRASDLIPDDMSAEDAASQFCGYLFSNLRETEEAAHQGHMDVPAWFARS